MTHKLKSLEDLKPAPYNPREISQEAAKGLSASIAQFGDISGLVWNRRSGHVVAGHQRLAALKELGAIVYGDPPRIVIEGCALMDDAFAIRVVDWDEPTEKAANIAANNPHTSGVFVDDGLQEILDSIQPVLPEFEELRLDLLVEEEREIDLPGGEPMEPPSLDAECLVEIQCSKKLREEFEATLNQWSERDGCTINIS